MELIDLYIHIDEIKQDIIYDFIKEWLNDFNPEFQYFEYPQYKGITEYETDNYLNMLSFVINKPGAGYRFYFENENNDKRPRGMIFINKNRSIYLGIGVTPDYEEYFVSKLKERYNSIPIICYGNQLPDE